MASRAMAAADYTRLHRKVLREMALAGLESYRAVYASLLIAPLRRIYAWAVPSDRALDALAKAGRAGGVVEIGAGTGLWAAALRERGVRVDAYDMAPSCCSGSAAGNTNWQHALLEPDGSWLTAPAFTAVARGDASAAARARRGAVLLLCWPPCEEDGTAPAHVTSMASDAIAAHAGSAVALVVDAPWADERDGGGAPRAAPQAAGPRALRALEAAGFSRVEQLNLPSWPSVPAQMQLWARPARAAPASMEPGFLEAAHAVAATVSAADALGARALRERLVSGCARELDELLVPLILRASGPLARGERVVLARARRHAGGHLRWAERLCLALRGMR